MTIAGSAPLILGGDVGGTKIACGLFADDGAVRPRLVFGETFAGADFPGLGAVVDAFLARAGVEPERVRSACFGVAGPVIGNATRTPNLAWEIDGLRLAAETRLPRVLLINDLLATAHGVPLLAPSEFAALQEGTVDPGGNVALIAAGTGLGMALLPRLSGAFRPVATEGGHQDFPPRDEQEIALLRTLQGRYGRVSLERVVSGPGLVAVYQHLRDSGFAAEDPELRDRMERTDAAAAISRAAQVDGDPLAREALDVFTAAYGAAAGNLALVAFATAGLYVGGGIAPKILDKLHDGTFLAAFRDKGRFRGFMERIPVRVILEPATAMLGAARVAAVE
ncbi:MAG TPA: glucokinase [Thermoanaerobaculia bacterium]|nr:glucokinase [Thermoanaerobaculia bacterium]